MKNVLWRVAKCLSYIEEARCLKVNKFCLKYNSRRGTVRGMEGRKKCVPCGDTCWPSGFVSEISRSRGNCCTHNRNARIWNFCPTAQIIGCLLLPSRSAVTRRSLFRWTNCLQYAALRQGQDVNPPMCNILSSILAKRNGSVCRSAMWRLSLSFFLFILKVIPFEALW